METRGPYFPFAIKQYISTFNGSVMIALKRVIMLNSLNFPFGGIKLRLNIWSNNFFDYPLE